MKFSERVKVIRKADELIGSARGFGLLVEEGSLFYKDTEGNKIGPADGEYILACKTEEEVLLENCLDKLNIVGEQLVMCLNNKIEGDILTEEDRIVFLNRIRTGAIEIEESIDKILQQ